MNDQRSTISVKYESVIGLEIHIELATKSKMFCACSADYFGKDSNSHTCPICLGLPGAMPKANSMAIKYAQKFGLALNCQVQLSSKFDRKNYFYPDLPKGFQISQYDLPLSQKGFVLVPSTSEVKNFYTSEVSLGASRTKRIGIIRVHLEEDTAKLTHAAVNGRRVTLIDFNRSGVPLLEIVSEPDIGSSEEAKLYAAKLQQIARYLEVSDADMEKGSMRIEPNVSLKKKGDKKFPEYKVELKNINSFRFAEKAIEFEIRRQLEMIERGETPIQETRGWDEKRQRTVSQRTKEFAHDYRYFPEPDLRPFYFSKGQIQKLAREIPELPEEKTSRFRKVYGLSSSDARIICEAKELADFYEKATGAYRKNHKNVANWLTGEILRRLKEEGRTISQTNLLPAELAELLHLQDRSELTTANAKEALAVMIKTGKSALEAVKAIKVQILSHNDLEKVVNEVIRQNQRAVSDFRAGKKASLSFLIGQVQKVTKGAADPKATVELIVEKIKPKS